MNKLICAVDEIFVGKIPSEDDLCGIHQVLVERRDAELDRQSVTDEAVKDAIEWAEREHGYCMRYMLFGDADSATLAIDALQSYQPTTRKDRIVEEVAISKTETTSCEWCDGGIDTASLMDADMMMRFVRPVNCCPNCGRKLEG